MRAVQAAQPLRSACGALPRRLAFESSFPGTRCAAGSSKPDEIHCCVVQGCLFRASFFESQRHSTISRVAGKTPMSRKGLIRPGSNAPRAAVTDPGKPSARTELTTAPRLTGFRTIRAVTGYQFMSANVTPWSLTEIQVPPAGSDGETTTQPFNFFIFGGRPARRVRCSSRFIPRR